MTRMPYGFWFGLLEIGGVIRRWCSSDCLTEHVARRGVLRKLISDSSRNNAFRHCVSCAESCSCGVSYETRIVSLVTYGAYLFTLRRDCFLGLYLC
jgi:hypothetical protein